MDVRPAAGWWVALRPAATAYPRQRLLVLPHSGAGPNSYRPLLTGLPDDVEVRGLNLPGRERRLGERPGCTVADVVASLGELADDVPSAVFGHSLGALLGVWVARELGSRCTALIVSGQVPGVRPRFRHRAPTEAEMIGLLELGDVPLPAALYRPRWRRVLLGTLSADLRLGAEATEFTGVRLDVPLTVLMGAEDRMVDHALVPWWAEHTSAECDVHVLPGGHFAVLAPENRDAVAELLGIRTGVPAPA
ncbi:thioesterase [Catellatospora sp. TT07R-123]|uniref:thioesterase II family protein n=1 Tax=Catellatospora sp. TT07R-123 TaxID=2733863 RepID=UPI001B0DBE2C|nr:alpha/beta fold hydrolase [Catellatospora sp. TT07R-123]GHJ48835.1 thioesterase [Catellatospora sp. TT07R-123]